MIINSGIFEEALEANEQNIVNTLNSLRGKENPYMILGTDDMLYMQTCEVKEGFVLEYQEGSLARHFRSISPLKIEAIQKALLQYLEGSTEWKDEIDFEIIDLRTFWYKLGSFIGKIAKIPFNFIKGFKEGYNENRLL